MSLTLATTPLSDDLSNLCRDYGSFINWAISKANQYPSKGWSDMSISEPDTLTLSQIASMHDYVQLAIDNMYVNANPEISTETFFRQLTAMMGLYTQFFEPHSVKVEISYSSQSISSSSSVNIAPYSIFYLDNLILTNPRGVNIPVGTSSTIDLVFGAPVKQVYKLTDHPVGEIFISDSVEVASLTVQACTVNESGSVESMSELTRESDIVKLMTSGQSAYQVTYRGTNLYRVKLSPQAFKSSDSIVVTYTRINSQSVASDSKITILEHPELAIKVVEDSEFTINSRNYNLVNYYKSLAEIARFNTSTAQVDFSKLQGRVSWYNFTYQVNPTYTIPKIVMITDNDKPLTGYGSNTDPVYLRREDISVVQRGNSYVISIKLIELPIYELSVNISADSFEYSITVPTTSTATPIEISVPSTVTSMEIKVQNAEIGVLYWFEWSQTTGLSQNLINKTTSEMEVVYSILGSRYPEDYPAMSVPSDITILSPVELPLTSEVITSQPSITIESILQVLSDKLLNEVVTNQVIMYSRIRSLILEELSYVSDIKFKTGRRFEVSSTQYLKLSDLATYQNQIKFVEELTS